jgi:tRNA G18 (ribose-2'-O)-methylase SpoU
VITRIDRPGDPRLAAYAAIADHDKLRSAGLFIAEGRLVVQRLIEARRFEIDSIVVTPAALNGLAGAIGDGEWPVYVCSPAVIEALTGIDFHRGCLALARRPTAPLSPSTLAGARRLLALEGIGNPDNLGGLFRVAAAFGVGGVLLAPSCADPFYRKSIRTSVGAVLRVPFTVAERWPADLQALRETGLQVVALTPDVGGVALREFAEALDPDARLALMLGAEGPGLTPEALRTANHMLRIPMAANVDSLNVTVAAGIALAFMDSQAKPRAQSC